MIFLKLTIYLNTKKQNKISEWIEHKISNTYIRLTEDIADCETLKNGRSNYGK